MTKKIRCIILLVICFILATPAMDVQAAQSLRIYRYDLKKTMSYTDAQVKVTLNGVQVSEDTTPGILVNGYAMVSYKDVFVRSFVGAKATYSNNKLTLKKGDKTIVMTVGSKTAYVNGKATEMPIAPIKVKYYDAGLTKILVPSRFVATTLGYEYTWTKSTSTVAMVKSDALYLSYNGKDVEYTSTQGKVTINGKKIDLGYMPSIIINGIAMLRAKTVFADSVIGATYKYSSSTKSVILTRNDIVLKMTLDSKTAYVNDKKVTLEEAPTLITNRETGTSYVMVPGRSVATNLGLTYNWVSKTSEITTSESNSNNGATNGNNSSNNSTNNGTPNGGTTNGGATNGDSSNGSNSGEVESFETTKVELNSLSYTDSDTLYKGKNQTQIAEDATITETNQVYNVYQNSAFYYSNAEAFVIGTASKIKGITSSKDGMQITVVVSGASTTDQTLDTSLTGSLFVQQVTRKYNAATNNTEITFLLKSEYLNYDVFLEDNGCDASVIIYQNFLQRISTFASFQGDTQTGDAIIIEGVNPNSINVNKTGTVITLDLPYAYNTVGYQTMYAAGAKYLNNMFVVGSSNDYTGLIINLSEDTQYATKITNDQFIIELGSNITSDNNTTVTPDNSGNTGTDTVPTPTPDAGDNVTTENPSWSFDKDYSINDALNVYNYQIVIPKSTKITASDITHEDYYTENTFVIRIKGDYTSYLKNNLIKTNSSMIEDISISLTTDDETEIRITTSKLQGYIYTVGESNIYIRIGDPKKIYSFIAVLDPGHGGSAPGAIYNKTYEKDINYKILYTLGKQYFNSSNQKIKVYYTRWEDVDVSLKDRATLASKLGADIFVSLHMNANTSTSPSGTEVYYSTSNNKANKAGLTSYKMATLLSSAVSKAIGTTNRGAKSAKYTVVHSNTVPAVLIEMGFMSNANDYKKMTNLSTQKTAAKAIYETICQIADKYPTGR